MTQILQPSWQLKSSIAKPLRFWRCRVAGEKYFEQRSLFRVSAKQFGSFNIYGEDLPSTLIKDNSVFLK